MQKLTNNNIFFQLNQPKLFNFLQYEISDNDPVRKLSSILEGLDFSSCKYFLTKQRYILSECFLSLFMPIRAI